MTRNGSTAAMKVLEALTAVLVIVAANAGAAQAQDGGRGPFEICANGVDDDGDDGIDESECQASSTSVPVSVARLVTPELWAGAPLDCADFGFAYGFKVNAPFGSTSRYYLDPSRNQANTELTGGAPTDPENYVDLVVDGSGALIDWQASITMDAVYLKAAAEGNLYVYAPEVGSDTYLGSPDLAHQISHVEFCYDYELVVGKTAQSEREETYGWTITKSVDDPSHSGFPGDSFTSSYEVRVERTVTADESITGTITITNPAPAPVSFTVSDVVDGTVPADVSCPSLTVPAWRTVVCSYTVESGGSSNTATVTASGLLVGSASVTVPVVPDPSPTIIGYPSVNITDTSGEGWEASDSATFSYARNFTCSTDAADYTNGVYTAEIPNTATIVESAQSDDASVTTSCYLPLIEKTAVPSYTRNYSWAITKSVTPASHSGFAGEDFISQYTVTVDRTADDLDFAVAGSISITNPSPDVALPIVSVIDSLGSVEIDCQSAFTVPAGGTTVCDYSADLGDGDKPPPGTNVATVSLAAASFTAEAPYAFGEPTTVTGYGAVNVVDSNGQSWAASDDAAFSYVEQFACPTSIDAYTAGTYSTFVDNRATIQESGQSDQATVTMSCYAPLVSKTASTSYTRTFSWAIAKSVTPEAHSGFAGDIFNSTYTVSVDQTVDDSDFGVSGTISIANPNPLAPMPIASVADSLGGLEVSCQGAFSVPAGGAASCDYTADLGDGDLPPPGTNVATVSLAAASFTATADYAFGAPTAVTGTGTVDVTDSNGQSWIASGDYAWSYSAPFECPTSAAAYTSGVFNANHPNTATITQTGDTDSASVTTTCYAPVVSKTANPSYTRKYTWSITKSVSPAAHNGFAGDDFTSEYTVTVDQTVDDFDFAVAGTISIHNPSPSESMPIASLVDSLGGVQAECQSAFSVPPAGTTVCSYTADLGDGDKPVDGTNVATVSLEAASFTAAANYAFGAPTTTQGSGTVDVTDTNGQSWTASEDASWTYQAPFECPTSAAEYTSGFHGESRPNTATIVETGQQGSASVELDCYLPIVTKDANAQYRRTITWDIEKSAAPVSHTGFPGDSFQPDYLVSVDKTVVDSEFDVTGTISIVNPNPVQSLTVNVSDLVAGAVVSVDCASPVIVMAAASTTCGYQAAFGDTRPPDGTNVAAIALPSGVAVSATADYAFGEPTDVVGSDEVHVTDTQPASGPLLAGVLTGESANWPYAGNLPCPTDLSLYDAAGIYTTAIPNQALIVETGDRADANVDLTCYAPAHARVVKNTTEGVEDIGQLPFTFELVDPAGGVVETASLNASGSVSFTTDIELPGTWTVREILPAGWVTDKTSCTFEVAFPASAGHAYVCELDNTEASRVTVLKWTQGVVDPTQSWSFSLHLGPDGFAEDPLGTASTFDDVDGLLEFMASSVPVDLSPFLTYTLCEQSVPAGWSLFVQVDLDGDQVAETTVVPYNPNADDLPPGDLGNRCVDLGADTQLQLVPGETLAFGLDNQYPGGDPRTPGYWKNWNRCTGGGQAANADRNGGWEEGFWLVENVLDPAIGGGVTWDDILPTGGRDIPPFVISSCQMAVSILDQRSLGDGKKMASDAAYTLAMHLLAAQMNFAAGAETCTQAFDAALDAEELLDRVNFSGTGSYLRKGADYNLALSLAATLDQYNNGELCSPSPP